MDVATAEIPQETGDFFEGIRKIIAAIVVF